jgi:hypothetical protein
LLITQVGVRQPHPVQIAVRVWNRGTEFVFHRICVVSEFNVGDERCAEHLLASAHRLQCDVIGVENGLGRTLWRSVGGAVDI